MRLGHRGGAYLNQKPYDICIIRDMCFFTDSKTVTAALVYIDFCVSLKEIARNFKVALIKISGKSDAQGNTANSRKKHFFWIWLVITIFCLPFIIVWLFFNHSKMLLLI